MGGISTASVLLSGIRKVGGEVGSLPRRQVQVDHGPHSVRGNEDAPAAVRAPGLVPVSGNRPQPHGEAFEFVSRRFAARWLMMSLIGFPRGGWESDGPGSYLGQQISPRCPIVLDGVELLTDRTDLDQEFGIQSVPEEQHLDLVRDLVDLGTASPVMAFVRRRSARRWGLDVGWHRVPVRRGKGNSRWPHTPGICR